MIWVVLLLGVPVFCGLALLCINLLEKAVDRESETFWAEYHAKHAAAARQAWLDWPSDFKVDFIRDSLLAQARSEAEGRSPEGWLRLAAPEEEVLFCDECGGVPALSDCFFFGGIVSMVSMVDPRCQCKKEVGQ